MLPLIAPAIVAGALLSVTLSIDEFVVTFFTIGPQLTLPLYIITQIKFGVTPEVNALATVILVGTLPCFGPGLVLLSAAGRTPLPTPRRRNEPARHGLARTSRPAAGDADPDRVPDLGPGGLVGRPDARR